MTDLSALTESGMNIDALPEEQKEALSRLDPDEVQALVAIRAKLNDDGEVSGHAVSRALGDGNIVW